MSNPTDLHTQERIQKDFPDSIALATESDGTRIKDFVFSTIKLEITDKNDILKSLTENFDFVQKKLKASFINYPVKIQVRANVEFAKKGNIEEDKVNTWVSTTQIIVI